MNISDLTLEQKQQVTHHLRSAALARAAQWDHESAIERILDREIDHDYTPDLAAQVAYDALSIKPEDLTFITPENLEDYIPDA